MPDRLLGLVVAVPFLLGAAAAPPADAGEVLFEFADPAIVESSGLAVRDGLVVTVNDSGDGGRVFSVDPATGETVGTTTWPGDPVDVEALAPAAGGAVWVGDVGDNRGARDSVEVLRVPVGRGDRSVDPERFELTYPDGGQDAESLLAHPRTGRLLVVTKSFFGGTVYAAPARLRSDRPNRLRALGPAPAIATDAAFFPDGRHVVVRGYSDAAVLAWPSLAEVGDLPLPDQEQGEGIAVAPDGEVLVSTEGQHAPVARVPVPRRLATAMAGTAGDATPSPAPAETPSPEPSPEPEPVVEERSAWPWLAGGALGLVLVGVLLRSLRPR